MTARYPNLNEYGITVEAFPVPTPRPVSARYPNARPATADAYLGEHIVICDGCMGIVKVLRTEGNTRIVGVVHEDRNDHGLHWFAVPIHPEPEPAPVTRFSHMRELVTVPDGRVGRVHSIQTTDKVVVGVLVGIDMVRVEVARYPEPTQ